MPHEPHSEIALHVERLNSEGQGVAIQDGFTFFVDGALPGEKIRGKIVERKRNYARVALLSIDQASPNRTKPECSYYEACGGCQIMHLAYPAQLEFKTKRVHDAMLRIAGIARPNVRDCLASDLPLHYRNKLQFHARSDGGKARIGFFAANSHRVVEIEDCLVHTKIGQDTYAEILRLLREFPIDFYDEARDTGFLRHVLIRSAVNSGEILVVFITRDSKSQNLERIARELSQGNAHVVGIAQNINRQRKNTILGPESRLLFGRAHLAEDFFGLKFQISAQSFFQVHTKQAERLFQLAISAAGLSGRESVLDAYSGTGVLALAIAGHAKQVLAIESNAHAVADAEKNAKLNNVKNIQFLCGEAENLFPKVGPIDVAFLDPPRKGCEPRFLDGLAALRPQKIVYISCDPATLARDLKKLLALGYAMESLQPVDMFPQTAHVESVACLVLSTSPDI